MDAPDSAFRDTVAVEAPAKVNLSLHVVGRRADGYHELDGLVAFAGYGDRLTIADAAQDELLIEGPMSAGLPAAGNLVTSALRLARDVAGREGLGIGPKRIVLQKNLPVAAGLGGGSADAAALLRAISNAFPAIRTALASASVRIGADVPMCLEGRAARVCGIGDRLEPLANSPAMPLLLVNPRIAVPTSEVFGALASRENTPPPAPPAGGFRSVREFLAYLAICRNDLEAPALRIAPGIGGVLAELAASGALVTRMSGSGATVFALFDREEEAKAAAASLSRRRPGWWVVATKTCSAKAA